MLEKPTKVELIDLIREGFSHVDLDKEQAHNLIEYHSFLIGTLVNSIEIACRKDEVDSNDRMDILSNAQMIKMLTETNIDLSTRI